MGSEMCIRDSPVGLTSTGGSKSSSNWGRFPYPEPTNRFKSSSNWGRFPSLTPTTGPQRSSSGGSPAAGSQSSSNCGSLPSLAVSRTGSASRRGIGGGMPIPSRIRPRFERRLLGSSTTGRTIEAYGPIERSTGASSVFRGRIVNGRDIEDESSRTGTVSYTHLTLPTNREV